MPIENINLGTAPTGEGGDTLRESFNKVNNNTTMLSSDLYFHTGNTNNPHSVTAEQTGAISSSLENSSDGQILYNNDGTIEWTYDSPRNYGSLSGAYWVPELSTTNRTDFATSPFLHDVYIPRPTLISGASIQVTSNSESSDSFYVITLYNSRQEDGLPGDLITYGMVNTEVTGWKTLTFDSPVMIFGNVWAGGYVPTDKVKAGSMTTTSHVGIWPGWNYNISSTTLKYKALRGPSSVSSSDTPPNPFNATSAFRYCPVVYLRSA